MAYTIAIGASGVIAEGVNDFCAAAMNKYLRAAGILLASFLANPSLAAEKPHLWPCAKDDSIDAQRIAVVCTQILTESFTNGTWAEDRYLAFYYRGAAEERLGQYERAEADYRASIKQGRAFSAPWLALGEMLEKLGHPDAAMAALDAMVSASPRIASVLNSACYARAVLNRQLDVALRDCDEALRIAPDDYNTLDSRCFVRFRSGDYANAIGDCDAALKERGDLPTSLYIRGLAKIHLGYSELGNADIAAATAIDPSIASTFGRYGVKP